MKIGIDISQVVYEGTGVSRFNRGLIDTILQNKNNHQWDFFFSSLRKNLQPDIEKAIRDNKYRLTKLRLPATLLSLLWNRLGILRLDTFYRNLDWFITSDWTEPPSSHIRKATIVHDLTFLRHPETVSKTILHTQQYRLMRVKKSSSLIFADSQTTRRDLIKRMNIENERIVVNYPGVRIDKPTQKQISDTLQKYRINKPFFFSVGKIEPRKNFNRLIKAFDKLNLPDMELLIAGPTGWESVELNGATNVRFLGYVKDEELTALYASCLFFIFPSIWEGFGYPIIEAMLLGAPVTCSDKSSIREIAGNAAWFFDPYSIDGIGSAIKKMASDSVFRERLKILGYAQSRSFTWKNYYNTMVNALSSY